MTCAKAPNLRCTIVTEEGYRFVGTNACAAPQQECPREPGEGYAKCETVCRQYGHAEVEALRRARDWAAGSTAYVEWHRVCPACQHALNKAGIARVVLGRPPE